MDWAHSLLEVKSLDEDQRIIRGIATTPAPDRMGDIVEPLGVSFRNPVRLLYEHDRQRAVGEVIFDQPTAAGVGFEARLPKIAEPASLKERVDTAWHEIKAGLIRGVSIGFRPIEYEPLSPKDVFGPKRFLKSEVVELSLVTVPANADANILAIRSIDATQRAASGQKQQNVTTPPGASGISSKEGAMQLTEQIAALEATIATKAATMEAVLKKATDEGRTSDAGEREEFDTLEGEVKQLEGDVKRLRSLEAINRSAATPISSAPAERPRAPIVLKQDLPKGTAFTRYVMAYAAAQGNLMQAVEIAKRWHNSTPEVALALKAAVAPGTTTDADWAKPLVEFQTLANEILDLIRPATIIGRVPGLRMVPFNTRLVTVLQDGLVSWVGEAKAKPVGEMKFGEVTLGFNKVAGIIVLSDELVRFSRPNAETEVRSNLVKVIQKFLDKEFIDPALGPISGIRPGSILNGVTGTPSSGTSAADANADIQLLLLAAADYESPVFITTKSIGMQLAMLKNPLGVPEFGGLSPTGADSGTVLGIPVVISNSVPAGILAIIDASRIMVADDGGVSIAISREATLEMSDAPADPSVATFNLWQNNCIGIRAERFITWKRLADTDVAYITGANYTGEVVAGP